VTPFTEPGALALLLLPPLLLAAGVFEPLSSEDPHADRTKPAATTPAMSPLFIKALFPSRMG
jgi:hypothetical protein